MQEENLEEVTPQAQEAPAAQPEESGIVTEEQVRESLKGLPGRWYVVHTYSGYEERVKQDLTVRIQTLNMEDYIFQAEVPMEQVYELRRGQRVLVSRVRMPGYVLVRMEMTDESWRVVQSMNGVAGFVGNGRNPVALTEDEVVKMLTPVIEAEAVAAAVAAGKPTGRDPELIAPFEVGDAVTLTQEPWAGMPATIESIDTVNQQLKVAITLVGQEISVELPFNQVRKED